MAEQSNAHTPDSVPRLIAMLHRPLATDAHCRYLQTSANGICWSQAAAHEACRVFRDCLVDSEHTAKFDSILANALRKHWRVNLDLTGSVFATLGSTTAQLTTGQETWPSSKNQQWCIST